MTKYYDGIPWLDDESYSKARWQFKAHAREALSVFKQYGMGIYIDGAVDELFSLAEDLSLRTRGIDKPLDINYIRRRK